MLGFLALSLTQIQPQIQSNEIFLKYALLTSSLTQPLVFFHNSEIYLIAFSSYSALLLLDGYCVTPHTHPPPHHHPTTTTKKEKKNTNFTLLS